MVYCPKLCCDQGAGRWGAGRVARHGRTGERGVRRRLGAHGELGHAGAAVGAGALGGTGAGARGVGARGRCSRRGAHVTRRPRRGLSMLLGQQAMHSVHSACFDPVSTQYCS